MYSLTPYIYNQRKSKKNKLCFFKVQSTQYKVQVKYHHATNPHLIRSPVLFPRLCPDTSVLGVVYRRGRDARFRV